MMKGEWVDTGRRENLERAEDFALRAIRLCRFLQEGEDRVGWTLGGQLLRSATPIGANLEEARSTESKRDFIHKCAIAQKEARETRYGLRLLVRSETLPTARVKPLLDESGEIYAMLTAIIRSAKRTKNQ
ncbi:MAG: hypothetical protein Rubg2KO_40130 [Rubricoccaceae bacterium]